MTTAPSSGALAPRPVTRDDFRASLSSVAEAADPVVGIFGPDSMLWRVNRTSAVYVLGITQAAFMDVAHPVIANGIADHSRLFTDPHHRAHQTYSMMTNLVFGDLETVTRTSRALFATHDKVRGHARADAGSYRGGGADPPPPPHRRLWVHATMWWVRLQTYEAIYGELSSAEREQYFSETCRLAGCFALPEDLLPADYAAWDAYVRNGPSDALAASDDSRRIMAFLRRQIPAPARGHLLAFNSVIVPDVVREVLDLPPLDRRTLRRHRRVLRALRLHLRLTPAPVRELPPHRAAHARLTGRRQDRVSAFIGRRLAGPGAPKNPTKKST